MPKTHKEAASEADNEASHRARHSVPFDFRRDQHSGRLQLHHRFHSPAGGRLPTTKPLESLARLAAESPLEHLPPAPKQHDPHRRRLKARPRNSTKSSRSISASFGAWTAVPGTTFNTTNHPGLIAPLARVTAANSCSNDQENNVDGLNTICFNQSSVAFTTGVLAFTRVITANAPGVSIGASGPAAFAGQILDADILFRNDNQATYATPAALATPQGQGAYDLESLLTHELGHWFGLDHSAVWRALMFPFAPPPGQFLGDRPTAQAPDGPLSDDDRAGIRSLYPDPTDSVNIGTISGRILPANPFALANIPSPPPDHSSQEFSAPTS